MTIPRQKSLYLAIDKKAIVENVAKGGQMPAWSFVPMGIKDDGEDFAAKKYYDKDSGDAAEAKALLKSRLSKRSGFKLTIKYNNNTGHQNIAVHPAMWAQLWHP